MLAAPKSSNEQAKKLIAWKEPQFSLTQKISVAPLYVVNVRLCCSFQALDGVGWWKHYGGSGKSGIVVTGGKMLSRRKKFSSVRMGGNMTSTSFLYIDIILVAGYTICGTFGRQMAEFLFSIGGLLRLRDNVLKYSNTGNEAYRYPDDYGCSSSFEC